MKKILSNTWIFILLFCTGNINGWAAPVDSLKAVQAAKHFFAGRPGLRSSGLPEVKILHTEVSEKSVEPYYYIVSDEKDNGWVILSGDDRITPVIGYADNGSFSMDGNPAFNWWMGVMKEEIDVILGTKSIQTQDSWNTLLSEPAERISLRSTSTEGYTDGTVLLSTTWNQGEYYNAQTPVSGKPGSGSEATYTGCVATALGQILKYWGDERNLTALQGKGYYEYKPVNYPVRSCDFSSRTYNLKAMPTKLDSSTDTYGVAQLLADCGVAVNMMYDKYPYGSGTINTYIASALYHYFNFKKAIHLSKDYTNMTADAWEEMIKTEIQNRRPVVYGGLTTNRGGHSFIVDGYDSNIGKFHFNWGWGGKDDGWYVLTLLNGTPTSIQFSQYQDATIGIEPLAPGEKPDFEITDVRVYTVSNDNPDCNVVNKFSETKDLKVKFRIKNNTNNNITGSFYYGKDDDGNDIYRIPLAVTVPYATETSITTDVIGHVFASYFPPNFDTEYEIICKDTTIAKLPPEQTILNLHISTTLSTSQGNQIPFNIGRNEKLIEYTANPLCENSGLTDPATAGEQFVVYPNPAVNQIKIQGKIQTGSTLPIYNVDGSTAGILYETGNQTYDVSHLPAGIYFLKIEGQTIKIIKK